MALHTTTGMIEILKVLKPKTPAEITIGCFDRSFPAILAPGTGGGALQDS